MEYRPFLDECADETAEAAARCGDATCCPSVGNLTARSDTRVHHGGVVLSDMALRVDVCSDVAQLREVLQRHL